MCSFCFKMLCFPYIIILVELYVCKVCKESLVGCWIWQKSKQRMHFTPMRASISTIGPPYGTKAPPPRSIPAEGLIHASRQRFTASFPALGSTVLIRSGLLTKEDFSLTHIIFFLQKIVRRTRRELREELRPPREQVIVCARTDAGGFALGQCSQVVEE